MTDCKRTHEFQGMKEMFYIMFMVVDRHLYIHLQNSLNSTLKTGECYSVKKNIPQKKIFKVTHNKSACFSKNHSNKNILLSKQIFICRKSGNNTLKKFSQS